MDPKDRERLERDRQTAVAALKTCLDFASAPDPDDPLKQIRTYGKWSLACEAEWADEQRRQISASGETGYLRQISSWAVQLCRLPLQWGGILAVHALLLALFVCLFAGVGLYYKGVLFGVLIDERRRVSLSRAQQVAWTIVLLSGIAVTAFINAGLLDGAVKSDAVIFPYVSAPLWAALGISLLASPYLSAVILASKQSGDATPGAPAGSFLVEPAQLHSNPSNQKASLLDLLVGETEGSQRQLDVSRIQHVIITGVLIGIYLMALAKLIGGFGGHMIVAALDGGAAAFPSLPAPGGTFLGLLALSHAGYLAFKARASDAPPGTAATKT